MMRSLLDVIIFVICKNEKSIINDASLLVLQAKEGVLRSASKSRNFQCQISGHQGRFSG